MPLDHMVSPPIFPLLMGPHRKKLRQIVEQLGQSQGVIRDFNATLLKLIPDLGGVDGTHKFRPIDLCNVIYKIISKSVANRLKPILPLLIVPERSMFM